MFLSKLIALFILVPIAELYILLEIGRRIGVYLTIGIVIVTGIAGAYLVKHQGFNVLYKIKNQMNEGILPTDSLLEGLLILIGGIFLATPGIITDIIGFLLIIPQSRSIVFQYLKKWLMAKIRKHDIYYSRNYFE
ncbi:MAG: FxsA family protein [Atribacterota bacterium]